MFLKWPRTHQSTNVTDLSDIKTRARVMDDSRRRFRSSHHAHVVPACAD